MCLAKFTITYHYKKHMDGDVDKRHTRTATVYAENLAEAINKISAFDGEYISLADGGVCINEIGCGKKKSGSNAG